MIINDGLSFAPVSEKGLRGFVIDPTLAMVFNVTRHPAAPGRRQQVGCHKNDSCAEFKPNVVLA